VSVFSEASSSTLQGVGFLRCFNKLGLELLQKTKIMRAVIQRVTEAQVTAGEDFKEIAGKIGPGLCVLVGVGKDDVEENADNLAKKIAGLRIFEDEQGKLNRSVGEIRGEALIVSQFTLYGDCRKGNRPSFTAAAPPAQAERLYDYFVARLRAAGLKVATGRFQTAMKVSLVNDGPVTLVIEN
jgi:D-aminoacyl-tRNA deacylase